MVDLSDKEKKNALNEVRILASIEDPCVVGYKEAFFDEKTNSLCLIMEYADDGDLYERIKRQKEKKRDVRELKDRFFKEEFVWRVLIQVLKGLKRLHEMEILHRDMKSANVFLCRSGDVKLGDLNVSKLAKNGLLNT